jgi:hypothetical protein
MAKKAAKVKASAKAEKTVAAAPSEVKAVIAERTFTTLVKDVRNADADIHDAQTNKGELIKKAKKSGLHVEAFKAFQKLARKSDKAAAEFLTHFEHYLEIGGVNVRVRAQGELLDKKPQLTEGDVAQVASNGGRKPRKKKNGEAAVAGGGGPFEPGVAGEAEGAVH